MSILIAYHTSKVEHTGQRKAVNLRIFRYWYYRRLLIAMLRATDYGNLAQYLSASRNTLITRYPEILL